MDDTWAHPRNAARTPPSFAPVARRAPAGHADVEVELYIIPHALPSEVRIPGLDLGVLPFTQGWNTRTELWQAQAQLLLIARAILHDPVWAAPRLGESVRLHRLAEYEGDLSRLMGPRGDSAAFAGAIQERQGAMATVVAAAENALLSLARPSYAALDRASESAFCRALHGSLRQQNAEAVKRCRDALDDRTPPGEYRRGRKELVHAIDLALDRDDERRDDLPEHYYNWYRVLTQQVCRYILHDLVLNPLQTAPS